MPSKNKFFNTIFSAYDFLKLHLHNFSKIKIQIESQNSRNQGFSYYFCMMIEGSGSGSWRPKNMWIRWIRIRIRNTDLRHCIASFWNCLLVILSQSMQYYVTRPHWKWFFFLRRSILLPFMLCEPVKPSRLLRSSSNVSTVYGTELPVYDVFMWNYLLIPGMSVPDDWCEAGGQWHNSHEHTQLKPSRVRQRGILYNLKNWKIRGALIL